MTDPLLRFSPTTEKLIQDGEERFLVVGGSGWLGQATLEMLDGALGPAFPERVGVFGSHERLLALRSGRLVPCRDLRALEQEADRPTALFHLAFQTKEKVRALGAAAFVAQNEAIGATVAGFAVSRSRCRIFVPSSGSVYRPDRGIDDDLDVNPYGVMKARDEMRFLALGEKGHRVAVCRIFNMTGPFINKLDDYVLGSIVRDILGGGPISLRAERRLFRSQVHVGTVVDLATALLLAEADPPPPFDTAGAEILEVGELAARAARVLGHPGMEIRRAALKDLPDDVFVGAGRIMAALLERHGIRPLPLDDQIRDTARYLKGALGDKPASAA